MFRANTQKKKQKMTKWLIENEFTYIADRYFMRILKDFNTKIQ